MNPQAPAEIKGDGTPCDVPEALMQYDRNDVAGQSDIHEHEDEVGRGLCVMSGWMRSNLRLQIGMVRTS